MTKFQVFQPYPVTSKALEDGFKAFGEFYMLLDRSDEMKPLTPLVRQYIEPALPSGTDIRTFDHWVRLDGYIDYHRSWKCSTTGEYIDSLPEGSTLLILSLGGNYRPAIFGTFYDVDEMIEFVLILNRKKIKLGWLYPLPEETIQWQTAFDRLNHAFPVATLEASGFNLNKFKTDLESWYAIR